MDDTQVVKSNSRTKVLANGAVYDLDKKRIVANPGGGTMGITQENASALARKRWEKVRRKVAEKLVEEGKAIDFSVRTPADALALLAGRQYTVLMDSEKPAIDQFEKLTRFVTGMSTENSQRENEPAAPGAITGSPDALMQLVALIERERRQAVEQARAVDGDEIHDDTHTRKE